MTKKWSLQEIQKLVAQGQAVDGVVVKDLFEDIEILRRQIASQQVELEALKRDAMSDPLTGLVNRRVFEQELERSLNAAKRYKRKSALLMLDLNNFKSINDNLGHTVGDQVLVHVSKLLKQNTRNTDVVARLGGDEFCIILNELTQLSDAQKRAQFLVDVIAATPCITPKSSIQVSVSIGVHVFSEHEKAQDVIEQADKDMYAQKENQR